MFLGSIQEHLLHGASIKSSIIRLVCINNLLLIGIDIEAHGLGILYKKCYKLQNQCFFHFCSHKSYLMSKEEFLSLCLSLRLFLFVIIVSIIRHPYKALGSKPDLHILVQTVYCFPNFLDVLVTFGQHNQMRYNRGVFSPFVKGMLGIN